jgi:type IV secretory pathway VirB6-like protein
MIVLGNITIFIIFITYLFIFLCSYLNNWDKKIPNLDVADDYRSERQEILQVQGKDFPFSFGDVC